MLWWWECCLSEFIYLPSSLYLNNDSHGSSSEAEHNKNSETMLPTWNGTCSRVCESSSLMTVQKKILSQRIKEIDMFSCSVLLQLSNILNTSFWLQNIKTLWFLPAPNLIMKVGLTHKSDIYLYMVQSLLSLRSGTNTAVWHSQKWIWMLMW